MFVKRMQHAIGQGGFHQCEIETDKGTFRYIYDCGSVNLSLIDDAISRMSHGARNFDWLVISSFDADHLNGATKLLDAGYSFKAVILPHLLNRKLLEQIIFYYLTLGMDVEVATTIEVMRRIIGGEFGRVIPGDSDRMPDDLDGDGLVDTTELARKSRKKISTKSYAVADVDWMLKFYSVELSGKDEIDRIFSLPSLKKLRSIIEKISDSLGHRGSASDIKNLLEELGAELRREHPCAPAPKRARRAAKTSKDDLLDEAALAGKKIKEILGCAYAAVRKKDGLIHDYNSASLCLYSGPIPKPHKHSRDYFRYCVESMDRRPLKLMRCYRRHVGWIGVGDITFKNHASVSAFAGHYADELWLAGTRMMPHHGAQSNYDQKLFQCRAFFNTATDATLWVAAADPIRGRYRHPDGVVVAEATYQGRFHLVSGDEMTTLEEYIR